jgi:hypothetical protein
LASAPASAWRRCALRRRRWEPLSAITGTLSAIDRNWFRDQSESLSAFALAVCLMAAAIAPGAAQQSKVHPAALIDIDALTAESDFTVFMGKDVPEDVRRNALRRLWVLLQLPVSCDELCYEPEPPPAGLARLASEKLPPAAQ